MIAIESADRTTALVAHRTPLDRAVRLSQHLGAEIWLKRDDLTGLGLGGNKVRVLECLIADARAQGADCIVTGAGPRSNWAMLAAAAANVAGLDTYLVYYGAPVPPRGNHDLAVKLGAHVRFTRSADRASVDSGIAQLARQLSDAGRRPYAIPRGGATPVGAMGYVKGGIELLTQADELDITPTDIWLPTGSCGTQAGLLMACRSMARECRVVGVTVSRPVEECRERVKDLATGVSALVDLAPGPPVENDVCIVDGFRGAGYGIPSPEGQKAAELVARTEGIFLDPVFGAKAMAALVRHIELGDVDGPVVFLVTGGAPNLFVPGTDSGV